MHANPLDALAAGLAHHREAGAFSSLPLDGLLSRADAATVQATALDAFADDFAGYALVGTSELARHGLGLGGPIYTPLPNRTLHPDGWRIHLPHGMIGAQCELVFTLGRAFPEPGETIDRWAAADAILVCQPAIGLLGRRVRPGPESELVAIADFALHVATVCGPLVEPADKDHLDQSVMTARIDDRTMVTASASAILGHPLEAIIWLARELSGQNRQLNAGDVVATGSCAPLLQVLPGQELTVAFAGIGVASCRFD